MTSKTKDFTITKKRLAEAAKKYEEFTGRKAGKAEIVNIPDPPREAVVLGEIAAITYIARKTYDGGQSLEYVHRFGKPRPKLLSDTTGKNLFIVGGKFKIDDRGIVG